MADTPPSSRTALLAGATGLIGRALLARLLDATAYRRITVLVRRAGSGIEAHPKLDLQTVDFAHLPTPFPAVDDVYIALGTTIKTAGSQEAFRQVDHDHVLAVAQAARSAGASRLAVVSALGANAQSHVFYNRVKGEKQQAIGGLGYRTLVIAQPSLLVGDRAALGQPVRNAEVLVARLLRPVMGLVPKGVRPIAADDVAAAMLQAVLAGQAGTRVLGSGLMQGAARA
jgi:uncharacterized protein YbjT (DUF2867 family)